VVLPGKPPGFTTRQDRFADRPQDDPFFFAIILRGGAVHFLNFVTHRFPAAGSQSCFFSPSPLPIISAVTGITDVLPGFTIAPASARW
jgi:hypothetical protein